MKERERVSVEGREGEGGWRKGDWMEVDGWDGGRGMEIKKARDRERGKYNRLQSVCTEVRAKQ